MINVPPRRPPSPAAALLFDLDGTLVDSVRLTCAIIDAMLAERGVAHRADPQLARAMDAVGGVAMIAAVMGTHCRDPETEIAAFRRRHAVTKTPADLAYPGVTEGLATLAGAGHAMAICTNKPQPLAERILADLGIAAHFAIIVGAAPDRPRKPAPNAARACLAGLDVPPQRAFYIGDSAVDAHTAEAAAVPFGIAGWGYGVADARAAAPDAPVFASMAALVTHVLGMEG